MESNHLLCIFSSSLIVYNEPQNIPNKYKKVTTLFFHKISNFDFDHHLTPSKQYKKYGWRTFSVQTKDLTFKFRMKHPWQWFTSQILTKFWRKKKCPKCSNLLKIIFGTLFENILLCCVNLEHCMGPNTQQTDHRPTYWVQKTEFISAGDILVAHSVCSVEQTWTCTQPSSLVAGTAGVESQRNWIRCEFSGSLEVGKFATLVSQNQPGGEGAHAETRRHHHPRLRCHRHVLGSALWKVAFSLSFWWVRSPTQEH